MCYKKSRVFRYVIIQTKECPHSDHSLKKADRSSKLLALKIITRQRTDKEYDL